MPTRKPSAVAPSPTSPSNRPPHEPTKVDRDTVSVMVAGGIAQSDIARARGIGEPTLRKRYRAELDSGNDGAEHDRAHRARQADQGR
jgi:hypothetical protein